MYIVNSLSKLIFATIVLVAAIPSAMQAGGYGSSVEIKSVDNYAGYSNVYTDKPNTAIKVVELNENKNPVRSWTGTTDADGKLTIPAGHNLSKPYLRAETVNPKMAEFITPSSIESGTPFTFSASGTVSGTVVNVQTLSGEVVATQKPDKLGRVFVPAGLAAGAYVLSANSGKNKTLGNIQIKQKPQGTLVLPGDIKPRPLSEMQLQERLPAINMQEMLRVSGSNINPNASQLVAYCEPMSTSGSAKRQLPVLAATPTEVVLPKLADYGIRPGAALVELLDTKSGKTAKTQTTVAYTAEAKLTQVKVLSGTETRLLVMVAPRTLQAEVRARILSGPVAFGNGAQEMTLPLANGAAEFRIQSNPGSTGAFQVSWNLDAPWLFGPGADAGDKKNEGAGQTEAMDDEGWVKFEDDDGRTGKKRVIKDKDGVRVEEIRYDDNGSYAIKTTRTTENGSVVKTDTTIPGAGDTNTVIEEEITYDKDGNQVAGVRKTWKQVKGGKKTLDKKETWDKEKGWK